jgi:hypothetical protein
VDGGPTTATADVGLPSTLTAQQRRVLTQTVHVACQQQLKQQQQAGVSVGARQHSLAATKPGPLISGSDTQPGRAAAGILGAQDAVAQAARAAKAAQARHCSLLATLPLPTT